ncbi:MAG: FAD-dependent monooxygenase [Thermoanaerobaculia bacterium]
MRCVSIGGGPAGLYFGILMRQAFPDSEVTIFERNRPDDTFGFGVVFSDETLSFLDEADPESAAEIRARFRNWRDIETCFRGTWTLSTGHGFCAISRAALLAILLHRAEALGCRVVFRQELSDAGPAMATADLVLAADGVNSFVRHQFADVFRPRIELGANRFSWLGSDKPLRAFTFLFVETEFGLFQVHAYPYEDRRSTFIVETDEATWRAAGLDRAEESDTVAICERLFAEHLDGHRLIANRSLWRRFPAIACERWSHENLVLVGDAAHTAHFSIGSGTKLAMEDAIALVAALRESGGGVPPALAAYEDSRRLEVAKLQRAARVSQRWFENARRYLGQHPIPFSFNLMTRSKRITYDKLRERDPRLVTQLDAWFASEIGRAGAAPVPPAFQPFAARSVELANRIVVSPMCQYSAVEGTVGDWHLVHLGSRALGGAGLVITEMTDVEPEGRITKGCAGLWTTGHRDAWRRIVEFAHAHGGTKIGIQLAHAGRKSSLHHPWTDDDRPLAPEEGAWTTYAPSAVPFEPGWPAPRAMDRADMDRIRDAFARAARWSEEAGFDWLELHMAHGYLLSSFLSPLANFRDDDYGGSLENRLRYPLEVLRAVRSAWPAGKPISVRISASDWMPDGSGTTPEEAVEIARALAAAGADLIDVSSAGNSPLSQVEYGRMYQTPFAEKIRYGAAVPVMAVGGIEGADHANTVIGAGRADLAVLARAHLRDPYLTRRAAAAYGVDLPWPGAYLRGKPRRGAPESARPIE